MSDAQRIAALEDRVTLLEDALGMDYTAPVGLSLTPLEAEILGMVLKARVATYDRMMTALYSHRNDSPDPDIIRVLICRIKKKVGPLGVQIHNIHGVGYWIAPEQKALLDA